MLRGPEQRLVPPEETSAEARSSGGRNSRDHHCRPSPHCSVGHAVTNAGHLTSGGADMAAVPIGLCNMDDPSNKVRAPTTVTESSGRYRFTVTDSVATTHVYILSAEGRSKNNGARVIC